MVSTLTLIGFGEAGSNFARAAGWRENARGYDIRPDRAQAMADEGIFPAETNAAALAGARVILSLVTADQALVAAQQTAPHVAAGALYFDMNSVSPDSKLRAAKAIEAAGGRYVDAAIMAPVLPQCLAVPLLLAGRHAEAGQAALTALGFTDVRAIGGDAGRAASIKMIRSVMVKGIEALTLETMAAAHAADVADDVLASLGEGWADQTRYRLERMATHGIRRAAEMEEAAKTLAELGIDPVMTRGTIMLQRAAGTNPAAVHELRAA